jgi:aquaporin Z
LRLGVRLIQFLNNKVIRGCSMKPYLAELVGTFVLVFGGVGSAVLAGDKIGNVGIALAFGLALLVMVYTIGPISGCHINPAVTLGLFLSGRVQLKTAMGYMLAQIIGAIIGAWVVLIIAHGGATGYVASVNGLGANGYGLHSPEHYSLAAAFIAEIVLTMFLVITVIGATDSAAPAGFAGIAIGLVLTLVHLVGIPITNTSVNPARSIGPALFVGGWALQQLWLFILAPFIGAIAASAIYSAISAHLPFAAEDRNLRTVKPITSSPSRIA